MVERLKEPLHFSTDENIKDSNYSDLGMTFNIEETMNKLSGLNFFEKINKWLMSRRDTTLIQPVITFDDNFDKRANELLGNNKVENETAAYDKEKGVFVYKSKNRLTRVDTEDLKIKLTTLTRGNILKEVNLIYDVSELEQKVDKINKSLMGVFGSSLDLMVGYPENKITLNPKIMRSITNIDPVGNFQSVSFGFDERQLQDLLNTSGKNIKTSWATNLISKNLTDRFERGVVKPVVLGSDTGPNTDGTIASKYIEIDISQQMMYLFADGQPIKNYRISTGLNYPTPTGNYKIVNKLNMGYSGIFGVWMPWWMAFDFRDDIKAWVGIHELPYKLNGQEKVYRFGNYIGQRKTGGCVALAPGESKEVYDFAYPGMDVAIFQ